MSFVAHNLIGSIIVKEQSNDSFLTPKTSLCIK